MPDTDKGASPADESAYRPATQLRSDVVPETSSSSSEPHAVEVKLSDGSVELRITPRPPKVSDTEQSTS